MTKVDFYILNTGSQEQLACKLVEKAYSLGHRIYIHTANEAQAKHMDELLWTYSPGSFLPHQRYRPGEQADSPIVVGSAEAPETDSEVLVNLAPAVPLFFSRFLRVAELVAPNDQAKQQGRERFRFYRDRGYPLDSHTLG